jgi:hypothetical protein
MCSVAVRGKGRRVGPGRMPMDGARQASRRAGLQGGCQERSEPPARVSDGRQVDQQLRRQPDPSWRAVRVRDSSVQCRAASRPATTGVATVPDPAIEVLRLDCSAAGAVTARCRWTAPSSPARVLTLWRSVDDGVRERVATFANSFSTFGPPHHVAGSNDNWTSAHPTASDRTADHGRSAGNHNHNDHDHEHCRAEPTSSCPVALRALTRRATTRPGQTR